MATSTRRARTGLKEKANRNQIAGAYCFGPFVLSLSQRTLTRGGKPVALTPKSFDLLALLAEHAGELVSREEIWRTLWPDMQVEDANLTNAIASVRRALGKDAVLTRPKHGYQLTVNVSSRPGVEPEVHALFEEAVALLPLRSEEALTKARDLLWLCIARAPEFAPAWAWLGRCCRFLGKYGMDGTENVRIAQKIAQAAFDRALSLDPELPCAHQFYALMEADQGRANHAMVRLVKLARSQPRDAQSFVGLIHLTRYCGLLTESLAAHRQAIALKPDVQTSFPHTLFNMCDYAGVIDSYGVAQSHTRGYLDLAAWAALDHSRRACTLARERLASSCLPPVFHVLLRSLLATIAGDREGVRALTSELRLDDDPESALYIARHLCRCGEVADSLILLHGVVERGYGCSHLLAHDPWLEPLRQMEGFGKIFAAAGKNEERARVAFRTAGGEGIFLQGVSLKARQDVPRKLLGRQALT